MLLIRPSQADIYGPIEADESAAVSDTLHTSAEYGIQKGTLPHPLKSSFSDVISHTSAEDLYSLNSYIES